jgi:hypothetical protein
MLPLSGCSTDSHKTPVAIPDPAPGKVTAFGLGKLSTRYDVNDAVDGTSNATNLAWDRSGNVYLMNASGEFDVLRMTPQGHVSRFARVSWSSAQGMVATPDGGLLIGGSSGLLRVFKTGASAPLQTSHQFGDPRPIGVRPDGSVMLLDGRSVWILKDDKATLLSSEHGGVYAVLGTVDASGTAYVKLKGDTLADMLVMPTGKAPYRLRISGNVPGTHIPISTLTPMTLAPAHGGGFYSMAVSGPDKSGHYKPYVIHVQKTKATVLIKRTGDRLCPTGKQYPALDSPCTMPWFVTQLGDHVMVMGSNTMSGKPLPALVVQPDTK